MDELRDDELGSAVSINDNADSVLVNVELRMTGLRLDIEHRLSQPDAVALWSQLGAIIDRRGW